MDLPLASSLKITCRFNLRTLPEPLKFLQGNAELAENLEEKGRPYFHAAMKRNCHGPPVGMIPAFVAAGLSRALEAKFSGHGLQHPCRSARHGRFPLCPWAGVSLLPDTPQ